MNWTLGRCLLGSVDPRPQNFLLILFYFNLWFSFSTITSLFHFPFYSGQKYLSDWYLAGRWQSAHWSLFFQRDEVHQHLEQGWRLSKHWNNCVGESPITFSCLQCAAKTSPFFFPFAHLLACLQKSVVSCLSLWAAPSLGSTGWWRTCRCTWHNFMNT